ncbi:MAG: anion permease [Desulfovibrio sp.]|nr:anion permease [Desulfovibrio sp.]
MSESLSPSRVLCFLGGPALLLLALALPLFGPLESRFGFGILFWMVWWWITCIVDIKLTCLVPIFVACVYSYMPLGKVLEAYVHREAVLIFGATAITCAWVRWGFARRLALNFLMRVNGSVRAQTAGWFLLCGATSFVVGNTTVAAMFAPVAVASLMYAGFHSNEQRWHSKAASNILIAVAWGASVGGMATPLGGGQSVVTYGLLNKYLGYDIYFIDWTLRMIPLSLLIMAGVAIIMYFMRTDMERFSGSKEFYRQELEKLGPMTYEEKISFYGFALAILLAVCQPLYAPYTKGPQWAWLKPTQMFCIIPLLLLFWPSRQVKGESILSGKTMKEYFPITILFMWPASVALSKILGATGAGAVFGQWLAPFMGGSDTLSIVAWSLVPNILSQVTSDTAAAGVMVPLAIEAMSNWRGLPFGAVPWVWITGSAISWSYAVASATGAQGIAAGYGANLRTMFVWGLIAAFISVLLTVLYFWVTVVILGLDFYIMPPA